MMRARKIFFAEGDDDKWVHIPACARHYEK
jgi:hypothetical protein